MPFVAKKRKQAFKRGGGNFQSGLLNLARSGVLYFNTSEIDIIHHCGAPSNSAELTNIFIKHGIQRLQSHVVSHIACSLICLYAGASLFREGVYPPKD